MPDQTVYDYVIAGAGTAGSLLANRLSADPRCSVLLLEAGGADDWFWIHIPIGYLKCIGNPRTDWCYRTDPEPGLNGRQIGYPRGRVLGGSSSINGMLYVRGQAADYDGWAAHTGDTRWAWERVLPLFMRHESHWSGPSDAHGSSGEWRVDTPRSHWEILERFTDAAVEAGIPRTRDFNRGDNFGIGPFDVNQRRGVRWNASKAFLHPIRHRKNLTVVTGALIDRVILENREARGLEYILGGERRRALAQAETILAAGAIGSPTLLERSGVGRPEQMRQFGIPVVHELPGVGENLQDHLQLRMIFKVSGTRTLNDAVRNPLSLMKMGLDYALWRRGPLAMAPSHLCAFFHSSPTVERPDLEFHVQPLSLERFGEPLHRFSAFTASVCNVRPTSRGTVKLTDIDPAHPPSIAPRYLSTDQDRRIAALSLRRTREIVSMPALARFRPEEHLPGPSAQSDEDLARAAGDIGTTIFHPVGTCAMGRPDDPRAVTDSELRVRGIQHLRVIDASVMPTITSGNTNSPTLMIAEHGADLILADRRSR
jgi:choline dehydrogenase